MWVFNCFNSFWKHWRGSPDGALSLLHFGCTEIYFMKADKSRTREDLPEIKEGRVWEQLIRWHSSIWWRHTLNNKVAVKGMCGYQKKETFSFVAQFTRSRNTWSWTRAELAQNALSYSKRDFQNSSECLLGVVHIGTHNWSWWRSLKAGARYFPK